MPLKQLGRYELIEELGHGSMGVVYKAFDPMLDRLVALKTVALELSRQETEAFERRFYREARSAGRLNHPNIVTIHDVGKTESAAYIAMEFLQGRSLRDILDSGVVLPIERIVDIAAQVADGLAFAHESGIVHRDIKPPNIMVLENGGVKITDFGIAVFPAGSRTLAGTVFGSPKYMSPEQIIGGEVDGRSDVFSLGAVLYEMLTGFAPFFGGDLEAVLYQVINEMPAAPTTRNKALPHAFDYIVAKALAKHPDDRYGSARAFAADLRNFRKLEATSPALQPARTLERRALRRRKGEMPTRAQATTASSAADRGTALASHASPAAAGPPATSPRNGAPHSPRRILLIGVPAAFLIFGATMLAVRTLSDRAQPAEATRAIAEAPLPAAAVPTTKLSPAAEHSATAPSAAVPAAIVPAATLPGATAPAATMPVATAPAAVAVPAGPVPVATSPQATEAPKAASDVAAATAKPRETAVLKPSARVGLAVSPWGEVYVDGKKRGTSPPITEIRLSPGKHRIELRNASFAPYAEMVNLEADGYVKIKHRFR